MNTDYCGSFRAVFRKHNASIPECNQSIVGESNMLLTWDGSVYCSRESILSKSVILVDPAGEDWFGAEHLSTDTVYGDNVCHGIFHFILMCVYKRWKFL